MLTIFLLSLSDHDLGTKTPNFTSRSAHLFILYCVPFAVTRRCGQPDYSGKYGTTIRTSYSACGSAKVSFLGIKTSTCKCSTDCCNNRISFVSSAGHAKLSTAMIVTIVVAGIMLKIGAWEIFREKQFLFSNDSPVITNHRVNWIQLSAFFFVFVLTLITVI